MTKRKFQFETLDQWKSDKIWCPYVRYGVPMLANLFWLVCVLTATSQSSFVLARTRGTRSKYGHSGRLLTHYPHGCEVRNYISISKNPYRSKFSYRFILTTSIIYGNTVYIPVHIDLIQNHLAMGICCFLTGSSCYGLLTNHRCTTSFIHHFLRLMMSFSFLAATKQLYEWYFLSVRPSVRLSHLFDYVRIIVSSWNFQELSHWTRVRSMQKVRGQRSRSQRSRPKFSFPDCNSSLNSHMMMKLYI